MAFNEQTPQNGDFSKYLDGIAAQQATSASNSNAPQTPSAFPGYNVLQASNTAQAKAVQAPTTRTPQWRIYSATFLICCALTAILDEVLAVYFNFAMYWALNVLSFCCMLYPVAAIVSFFLKEPDHQYPSQLQAQHQLKQSQLQAATSSQTVTDFAAEAQAMATANHPQAAANAQPVPRNQANAAKAVGEEHVENGESGETEKNAENKRHDGKAQDGADLERPVYVFQLKQQLFNVFMLWLVLGTMVYLIMPPDMRLKIEGLVLALGLVSFVANLTRRNKPLPNKQEVAALGTRVFLKKILMSFFRG